MHKKLYDLFIVGMHVEYYVRKGYKGFGGEFEELVVPDCKYHLYFENCYGHKYDITVYDEEKIDKDNWGIITKGYIDVSLLKEFPPFDYIIKKSFEPLSLSKVEKSVYLTSPFFDFSKHGNNREYPRGYAKINFEVFDGVSNMDKEEIKEKMLKLKENIKRYYKEGSFEPEKSLNDSILDDDSVVERWLSAADIRHRGSGYVL